MLREVWGTRFLTRHSKSLPKSHAPIGLGSYRLYPAGTDKDLFEVETYMDALRRFVEGCDKLQGYNMTCDALSAFGGLTRQLAEEIRDDFGPRPLYLTAVHDVPRFTRTHRNKQEIVRRLNNGFSTIELVCAYWRVYGGLTSPRNPHVHRRHIFPSLFRGGTWGQGRTRGLPWDLGMPRPPPSH
jgi:hypothetical protein